MEQGNSQATENEEKRLQPSAYGMAAGDEIEEILPDAAVQDDEDVKIYRRIPVEREMPVTEYASDNDEILKEIGSSITQQMEDEIFTLNGIDKDIIEAGSTDKEGNIVSEKKGRFSKLRDIIKGMPGWAPPAIIALLTVLILGLVLFVTPLGRKLFLNTAATFASSRMNYQPAVKVTVQPVVDEIDTEEPKVTIEVTPVVTPELEEEDLPRHEDYAVNILLLGEETIESEGSRGRTDMMMIATMNLNENSFKLTTLMRDMLVSIPGYEDNKLNTVYQIGGVKMLYEVLELNFDIKMDGYALVDFESFETVIDELGGVDIELTETEASYLNSTNYISEPKNRCVQAGMNLLNGNQALGYCRIRHVGTKDYEYNDFGRTSRQKRLLISLVDKYRSLNYADMMVTLNQCLPIVTTDIDSYRLADYLDDAFDIGFDKEVQIYRLPKEGAYISGRVRKMSVLVPDLQKNTEALHRFIFGDYIPKEEETGQTGV